MDRSLKFVFLGITLAGLMLSLPIANGAALAADLSDEENADGTTALRLYKEGRYEDAVKTFVALSVAHPDMLVFIRNTGACYYYLRKTAPALSSLREYLLKKKDITPEDQAEVQGWIAEIEQLRSAAVAPAIPVATPAPPVATNPRHEQPSRVIEPRPPAEHQDARSEQRPGQSRELLAREPSAVATAHKEPSNSSVAPWLIGGVGLAALATGGVFSYLSQSRFSETEARYNASKESRGKTYAYVAAASYGLGAASLVASGIMLLTGGNHTPSQSVALAPLVAPNTIGATIHYGY